MEIDRRGLFAVGVALLMSISTIAYAGYLGSQSRLANAPASLIPAPSPSASPLITPSPAASQPARSIAFLGDSWTLGEGTDCTTKCSFAALTASQVGMTLKADAVAGTGYANGGGPTTPGPDPFGSRAGRFEALAPDVAIIAGGQSDSSWNPTTVQKAAGALMAKLKQDLPRATIVVVGPFSAGQPSPTLLATRDAILAAAKATGLFFVDPIADQWITGATAAQYIGPDGQNPNAAGHKYLADRLVAALKQLKAV